MYEKLLFPAKINNRTIKNKIIASPPPSFLCEKDGSITPAFFNYYKNLSNANPGILIIENSAISKEAVSWPNQCLISDENNFLAISELVIKIRNQDILPVISLYHGGINALPSSDYKVLGPSNINNSKIPRNIHSLSNSEIDVIVEQYKKAASLAWNVGFSGIELNAANGSLIHQFLSPITNKRTDEYSYGYDNGIIILRKIVQAIKSVASDLLFILKLSMRDLIPGGSGLKSAIEIAESIKDFGVDLFHLTEGLKIAHPECLHPYLINKNLLAPFADDSLIFKNETHTQVALSSVFTNPEIAEKYLIKGNYDYIVLERILNREPEWINMAMNNQPLEFYKKCKNCMICKAAKDGCIEDKIKTLFL